MIIVRHSTDGAFYLDVKVTADKMLEELKKERPCKTCSHNKVRVHCQGCCFNLALENNYERKP